MEKERGPSSSRHSSLFLDCGSGVASCFKVLPRHKGCTSNWELKQTLPLSGFRRVFACLSQLQEKKLRHLLKANSVPGTVLHLRWRRTESQLELVLRTEGGDVGARRGRGMAPARRLTVRLAVPTPEELQRRQPRARRAHDSPSQEAIQKPQQVPVAGSEALSSHRSGDASALPLPRLRTPGFRSLKGPIASPGTRHACSVWSRLPEVFAAWGLVRPLVTSWGRSTCLHPWSGQGDDGCVDLRV